jgi:hypothetical protein
MLLVQWQCEGGEGQCESCEECENDMMLCRLGCYFSARRVRQLLRCSTYHKLIVKGV